MSWNLAQIIKIFQTYVHFNKLTCRWQGFSHSASDCYNNEAVRTRGFKMCSMLNSAEHVIYPANKC